MNDYDIDNAKESIGKACYITIHIYTHFCDPLSSHPRMEWDFPLTLLNFIEQKIGYHYEIHYYCYMHYGAIGAYRLYYD